MRTDVTSSGVRPTGVKNGRPLLRLSPAAERQLRSWTAGHPGLSLEIASPCSAPALVHLRPITDVDRIRLTRAGVLGGLPLFVDDAALRQCPHRALIVDLLDIRAGRPVLVTRPQHPRD